MRGSIEKRVGKNGAVSWRVRYEVLAPEPGKRAWRSETFSRRQDAERSLRERLQEIERGTYVDSQRVTVNEVLDRWLESRRTRVDAKQWGRYKAVADQHLRPLLGNLPLAKLRPAHIEHAMIEWAEGKRLDKRRGQRSMRTVEHHYETLRAALRWAAKADLLARNPIERVEAPKVERQEQRFLDPSEARVLMDGLAGTALHAPVVTTLGCGLRRGEILGLTWGDIDLTAGRLTVRRCLEALSKGELHYKEPKTRRSRRTVALPGFVIECLRAHRLAQLARLEEAYGELEARRRQKEAPVFDDGIGRPWSPAAFTQLWYRAVRSRKLPTVRLHDLRHSFASIGLAAGIDLKTISAALGHSEIGTTGNIYLHVLESLQREAADRLDAVIRKSS